MLNPFLLSSSSSPPTTTLLCLAPQRSVNFAIVSSDFNQPFERMPQQERWRTNENSGFVLAGNNSSCSQKEICGKGKKRTFARRRGERLTEEQHFCFKDFTKVQCSLFPTVSFPTLTEYKISSDQFQHYAKTFGRSYSGSKW